MKVIYKMKNILIQEFQHCLESWLIQVMIHKMLLIQFVSNVIDESDLQYEKHFEPSNWTEEGIIIDWSDEDENAFDSIRVKCEFDSNMIDESDLQYEKHFNPTMSTLWFWVELSAESVTVCHSVWDWIVWPTSHIHGFRHSPPPGSDAYSSDCPSINQVQFISKPSNALSCSFQGSISLLSLSLSLSIFQKSLSRH
jgi:hypothetical protein